MHGVNSLTSMMIIADAGSTKIDWAIVDDVDGGVKYVQSAGINPTLLCEDRLKQRLQEVVPVEVVMAGADRIWYYGAGCIPAVVGRMSRLLGELTGCNKVCVESDLLGAARVICGHEAGIAAILGTGSGSCLYDGEKIVDTTPSLGYILGDEGSGAVIGRHLVGDILKGVVSPAVRKDFQDCFGFSASEIVQRVYGGQEANKFLASFVPFVSQHIHYAEIETMVMDEMTRFVERNLLRYEYAGRRLPDLPIGFVGSVARFFSEQLGRVLSRYGISEFKVVDRPLARLVDYHLEIS